MRPHSNDSPAGFSKKAAIEPVTFGIAIDLAFPIGVVVFGHPAMPSATMPKTSINEDGNTFTAENEVGPAKNRLVTPPTSDPVCAKDRHEPQLGVVIALRSDRRHDLGALLPVKNICHLFEGSGYRRSGFLGNLNWFRTFAAGHRPASAWIGVTFEM